MELREKIVRAINDRGFGGWNNAMAGALADIVLLAIAEAHVIVDKKRWEYLTEPVSIAEALRRE